MFYWNMTIIIMLLATGQVQVGVSRMYPIISKLFKKQRNIQINEKTILLCQLS